MTNSLPLSHKVSPRTSQIGFSLIGLKPSSRRLFGISYISHNNEDTYALFAHLRGTDITRALLDAGHTATPRLASSKYLVELDFSRIENITVPVEPHGLAKLIAGMLNLEASFLETSPLGLPLRTGESTAIGLGCLTFYENKYTLFK